MSKPSITPEIRREFDELDVLTDKVFEFDESERIKIYHRWIDFMKKYRTEFSFTDEQIASAEQSLAGFIASAEKARHAEVLLVEARRKKELSVEQFDDALVAASAQRGKPVAFPAYKTKKRNSGN